MEGYIDLGGGTYMRKTAASMPKKKGRPKGSLGKRGPCTRVALYLSPIVVGRLRIISLQGGMSLSSVADDALLHTLGLWLSVGGEIPPTQ